MNTPAHSLVGPFTAIWPRIFGFSDTPSLLALALVANLVAVIPTAFRMHGENRFNGSRA